MRKPFVILVMENPARVCGLLLLTEMGQNTVRQSEIALPRSCFRRRNSGFQHGDTPESGGLSDEMTNRMFKIPMAEPGNLVYI
jgi:hypothetical protein